MERSLIYNIEHNAQEGNDPMVKKWYPIQKGGDCRFWYGNLDYVVNWENDGYEMKNNYIGKRLRAHNFNGNQQFKSGITWNSITSSLAAILQKVTHIMLRVRFVKSPTSPNCTIY